MRCNMSVRIDLQTKGHKTPPYLIHNLLCLPLNSTLFSDAVIDTCLIVEMYDRRSEKLPNAGDWRGMLKAPKMISEGRETI